VSRLRDLKGFGPKSEEILAQVGIESVAQFMQVDAFELYADLKKTVKGTGLNSIYAILGAQQNVHWQEVARTQKYEILLRLDDMGLAPAKPAKKVSKKVSKKASKKSP
jgi:DNA transformation protein